MTIVLAVLVTDAHNMESLYAALPAGTTVTTLTLSDAEWPQDAAALASQYLLPMAARTRQGWTEARRA